MKVVILCGGLGTRMQEETGSRPKPMVAIGRKPILWHIMKIFAHYGYKDFILCLGYRGEMIKEYFYNYEILNNDFTITLGNPKQVQIDNGHPEIGWRITLVDTGDTTLKGARIKKIEKYVDTDLFAVTYGDGVANIDIGDLIAFHKQHGKIGTVSGVRPPSRFGELVIKNDKVTSFTEKPQLSEGLINGGFFVFSKKIFKYLSDDEQCDFEIGPLEQLARDGELRVYKHDGSWECMDTLRDIAHLNKLWQNQNAFWKVWND